MKQLGYTDNIFFNLETPKTPQQIGFMGIYDPSTAKDGIVRFKEVLANFQNRLGAIPTFRTRLVQVPGRLDRPYWVVDDSFDVEYHIRHLALPQPGDWRQLCIQVARLSARPLDLNRPLWECNIIEGLDNIEGLPKNCFAFYLKIHHSLVDGDLGQRIMAVLHDLEPYPPVDESEIEEEEEEADEEYRLPRMGGAEMVTRAFTNRVKGVIPTIKTTGKVVSELVDTGVKIAKGELPAPAQGPKTRFDEPVGAHRSLEAAEFSLSEIKAINRATTSSTTKTTVNDVCVAICSGGMRKYLQHYGELPEESLVGNLPVNMRKRGGDSDDNNQIASMMTLIHTDIEDPVDRLFAVHEEIGEAKKLIGTPLSNPFKIGGLLPPFMAYPISRFYSDAELTRYLPAGTPCVITNVPGPQLDLFANGAKLVKMYLLGMLTPGVGLFHAIFSCGDILTITVLADRDQMPDPAFYRQCMEESFAELKAAVLDKPKPKAKRKKAAAKAKAS